jgi:hypothetical protein
MNVNVRVLGYLGKYCGMLGKDERSVDLPRHATARELLVLLGIPEKENLLFLVNGKVNADKEMALVADDTVWIYPFVGGG